MTTTTVETTTNGGGRFATGPKDNKPIWAQKNILKKASENSRTFSASKKVVEPKAVTKPKIPEPKTGSKPTDCITSSYGIGPTDEEGRPIFGLRALKKQHSPSTKISGTVVQESYYSENGGPPSGQRSVTVYTNDENGLDEGRSPQQIRDQLMERENSRKNIVAVTKTQRIVEGEAEPVFTTNVVRRGSVKEISEKFIQKESSESMSSSMVKSSEYPKAGLILRSQQRSTSRSPTPQSGGDLDESETVQIRSTGGRRRDSKDTDCQSSASMTTTTTTTRSFLNSAGSKVTDVADLLDRMKNADNGRFSSPLHISVKF